jgi:hypothetical protein
VKLRNYRGKKGDKSEARKLGKTGGKNWASKKIAKKKSQKKNLKKKIGPWPSAPPSKKKLGLGPRLRHQKNRLQL